MHFASDDCFYLLNDLLRLRLKFEPKFSQKNVYMQKPWKLAFSCLSIKFFYIVWRMFRNRQLILVIQQNFLKVKCFAKLENWNVAKETSYRFHTIHMTILLDLSSVLIIFVVGNSLIKTSFEAKVIRSLEN